MDRDKIISKIKTKNSELNTQVNMLGQGNSTGTAKRVEYLAKEIHKLAGKL